MDATVKLIEMTNKLGDEDTINVVYIYCYKQPCFSVQELDVWILSFAADLHIFKLPCVLIKKCFLHPVHVSQLTSSSDK